MKIKYKLFTLLCLYIFINPRLYANTHNSNLDIQDKPNTWGIGLATIINDGAYKNTPPSFLPIPVINYQGKNLKLSGPLISYKFLNYQYSKTSIQAFLYPMHFKASSSNNSQMKKLNNRRYIIMGGLNQELFSPYGIFKFSLNADITGQTNGFNITTKYSIPFIFNKIYNNGRLILNPGIGLQYSSHSLTNYYYGISSSEEKKSGLTAYQPSSSLTSFVNLTALYLINSHWNMTLITNVTRLDNTLYNSPMVDSRYNINTYLSVVYKF